MSAPAPTAPTVPATETLVTDRGLDRTGKIVALVVALLGLITLPAGGWYAAQTSQAQKTTYYDTLIQERGARSVETREKLDDLTKRFEEERVLNAQRWGRTDASLEAIKDALKIERDDRKETRK